MITRFHSPVPLAAGAIVDLSEEAGHHAVKVLRMGIGDQVRLFDGRDDYDWIGRIEHLKPRVAVALQAQVAGVPASPLRITLVQCLPAADKMDYVVQKSVELGVAAVQPVVARRSVLRLSGERMERRVRHWQAVAVAACEQCGRSQVPVVAPLVDLEAFLARPAPAGEIRFALLPGGETRLKDQPPPAGPVSLLVGPEGGFEEGELNCLRLAGYAPAGFGPRVMRTETAGPAVIAALQALWGDA